MNTAHATLAAVAAAFGLAACSGNPDVVPVIATPQDLSALTGIWEGHYVSKEGDTRVGEIYFDLQGGHDTAHGHVIVTFATAALNDRRPKDVYPSPPFSSDRIGIKFVLASAGSIAGELQPYSDPECGCRLATTFTGLLYNDKIKGTFVTRHIDTNTIVRGTWSAARKKLR